MKVHYSYLTRKLIRLGKTLSLIFFAGMFTVSCSDAGSNEISIVWEKSRAMAIAVPKRMLDNSQMDSIGSNLVVHLKGQQTSILGDYRLVSNNIIFTPAVPFTPGKEYEVVYKKQLLKQFLIPFPESINAPQLLSVFPSTDTLPENVLKLYFSFSGPMREGEALRHISILNSRGDTMHNTFLDLQPELWSADRSVLTIWFDPGRIKRDLKPNLAMGNPLANGEVYTLTVCSDWKDVQGLSLKASLSRKLVIKARDSVSPDPLKWNLVVPAAESTEPLNIDFNEALDYFLLKETVSVRDEKGATVPGAIDVFPGEKGIAFNPSLAWTGGRYRLRVASKLEDLAGNNLTRLFEHDNQQSKKPVDINFIERSFTIAAAGNRSGY